MQTVNQVTILGHCTADPEPIGGEGNCKLVITTNSGSKDNRVAHHHRLSVFDSYKTDFIMKYIKKGMIVFAQGELQYSKTEDGKYFTSIVVGRFNSTVELCEKKNSSGTSVADDDAPPF
tara:strand:+ start:188 stop:544 length:357 start_codon:yes stop_codon:yes gene_type:complete